jgi:hypothetical protein
MSQSSISTFVTSFSTDFSFSFFLCFFLDTCRSSTKRGANGESQVAVMIAYWMVVLFYDFG